MWLEEFVLTEFYHIFWETFCEILSLSKRANFCKHSVVDSLAKGPKDKFFKLFACKKEEGVIFFTNATLFTFHSLRKKNQNEKFFLCTHKFLRRNIYTLFIVKVLGERFIVKVAEGIERKFPLTPTQHFLPTTTSFYSNHHFTLIRVRAKNERIILACRRVGKVRGDRGEELRREFAKKGVKVKKEEFFLTLLKYGMGKWKAIFLCKMCIRRIVRH